MSPREHQATLRPLARYEPSPRRAEVHAKIPTQQRPYGQLSLRPPAQQQPPADPPFDHEKLAAVLRAVVEVYGGSRDLRQLRHALHPEVQRQLATPVRTPGRSYLLRTVHARSTNERVIEACGTVHHGDRALAMCARFDRVENGWLCSEFTMMEPRGHRPLR